MVIAFGALTLVRDDVVTKGPRFYPVEQLYRRLNQAGRLPETQWNLARTLFSILLARGELEEKVPEYFPTIWLRKTAKLFKLSLPKLMEHYQKQNQLAGLLAVVPDPNFKSYLDQEQHSSTYVTPDGLGLGTNSSLNLEQFAQLRTDTQLCAAFREIALFNERTNPRTAGFVNL